MNKTLVAILVAGLATATASHAKESESEHGQEKATTAAPHSEQDNHDDHREENHEEHDDHKPDTEHGHAEHGEDVNSDHKDAHDDHGDENHDEHSATTSTTPAQNTDMKSIARAVTTVIMVGMEVTKKLLLRH